MTDDERILRTLAEYCQFLDSRRFDEWVALFTEDGTWDRHVGREAIRNSILGGQLAKQPELHRKHMGMNAAVTVSGDEARASSDYVMFDAMGNGPWAVAGWGRYQDRLVRRGERWLFAERKFVR